MFNIPEIVKTNIKLGMVAKMMQQLPEKTRDSVSKTILAGANATRTIIIKGMQRTPPAPWFYKRGKSGRAHHPSLPGNFPATDSGALKGSILFDAEGFKFTIGSRILDPPYPKFLEEGTKRIFARPWLEPAMEQEKPILIEKLRKIIPEIINKVFK